MTATAKPWEPVRLTVADELWAERRRQIEAEGWSPEHDDKHDRGQMALAAASYAVGTAADALYGVGPLRRRVIELRTMASNLWPWLPPANRKDERRDLVRAGALIIAEIERLDRSLVIVKPKER